MVQCPAAHHHVLLYLRQGAASSATLVVVTAIFAPLEAFLSVRKARFFYPGWATNLGWYAVDGLFIAFLLGPPSALLAWAIHAVIPAGVTGAASALPFWAKAILAMLVGEVGFYWGHRWSHEIPWLWRFHAVHHSAEHIGYLVNTRAHPVDMIFTRLCGLALLYATGLATTVGPNAGLIPVLVLFVGSMWSYFIHANVRVRLGFLEEVISTPAFHHWHHTREDHKDRNYSSMVPVMDRIFGAFYLPRSWPSAYGTDTYMPQSVSGQMIEPFAPARRPVAEPSRTPAA
jgi:sterol desaturase/sphingolipid hydroxylase (fatty acid hydroxylase superfamily)